LARPVSDEVWRQLDPHVGRLRRPATARVWLAAAVGLGLAVGFIAVWRSGIVVTQLVWTEPGPSGYDERLGGPIWYEVGVANVGEVPVTILGAGASAQGMPMVRVDGRFPTTIRPGEDVTFVLNYLITDCTAVPPDPGPLLVRVKRPWGHQTVPIPPPDSMLSSRLRDIADVQCGRVAR
jgi:hypothetical protein